MGKKRLPADIKEQIIAELGTMPDQELADKYSERTGLEIKRHTIFYYRKSRKVDAFQQKGYTDPGFRGRIEDTHPEIEQLLGQVPIVHIAKRYGVSRACIRACAKRLGKDTRATDFTPAFDAVDTVEASG